MERLKKKVKLLHQNVGISVLVSLAYINQWSSPNIILKVYIIHFYGARGGALGGDTALQLKGRGFDSRWFHWNFSSTQSFRLHFDPGVDSASNIKEYQEYFPGVKAAGAYG